MKDYGSVVSYMGLDYFIYTFNVQKFVSYIWNVFYHYGCNENTGILNIVF